MANTSHGGLDTKRSFSVRSLSGLQENINILKIVPHNSRLNSHSIPMEEQGIFICQKNK